MRAGDMDEELGVPKRFASDAIHRLAALLKAVPQRLHPGPFSEGTSLAELLERQRKFHIANDIARQALYNPFDQTVRVLAADSSWSMQHRS